MRAAASVRTAAPTSRWDRQAKWSWGPIGRFVASGARSADEETCATRVAACSWSTSLLLSEGASTTRAFYRASLSFATSPRRARALLPVVHRLTTQGNKTTPAPRSQPPTNHTPPQTHKPPVAFGARRAPLCSAQARRAASRAPTGTCTVLCATGGARAALPPPPPPLPPGPLLQAQSKPPSAALRRRRACVGRAPSPHCNMKWTQSGAAVVTALRPPPLLRKQSPSRHAAAAAAAGTAAVAPGLRSARAATTAIAVQQEEGRKQ